MSPSLPRTVLVTGGAGLIGASVVRALLAEGARVLVLDDGSGGARLAPPADARVELVWGDVRDRGLLGRLLQAAPRTTALVHLAARVGVRTVLADPLGSAAANLDGVRSVLDAVRAVAPARRPRIIAASSSEVYAESTAPLHEGSALRVERDGRWTYAAAKLAGERLFDAESALWAPELAPIHLRFFNVVGPGQDAASGMVLPRFIEAARQGAPLEVHGDGAQVRTFAHVEDVARDVAALALGLGGAAAAAGALNLGGTACASVLELAQLVAERAAHRGLARPELQRVDPVRVVSPGFADVRHRVPDLGRARALGLAQRARSLASIVDDMFGRHFAPALEHRPHLLEGGAGSFAEGAFARGAPRPAPSS
ncbi:MAG: NAD-dependent epimerase/dehydratase family protein [Planctomycetota bacterium]